MQSVTLGSGLLIAALAGVFVACVPDVARAEDAAAGEKVFVAQKCSMCHSVAGKGGKVSVLDGVGSKLTAAQIKEWIVDPVESAKKYNSTKKPPMPKKFDKLPAAELDGLVAYLASLKK